MGVLVYKSPVTLGSILGPLIFEDSHRIMGLLGAPCLGDTFWKLMGPSNYL